MKPVSVTCCIVTYNSERYICRAINSLLKYTKGVKLNIFIVDNASSDDTVKIIRESFPAEQFPQLTLIQNTQNLGLPAANNLLLDKLDSDYHVIMNPDIEIRSDIITKMTGYLEKHKDIGLLSPRILNPDGTEQYLPKREPKLKYILANRIPFPGSKHLVSEYTMSDRKITKPTDIEMATGCFMLMRTSLFKKIGGFDEGYFLYFEDADLTCRIRNLSRAVYYPQASVFHEWTRGSLHSLKLLIIHVRSMFRFFSKRRAYKTAKRRNSKY